MASKLYKYLWFAGLGLPNVRWIVMHERAPGAGFQRLGASPRVLYYLNNKAVEYLLKDKTSRLMRSYYLPSPGTRSGGGH